MQEYRNDYYENIQEIVSRWIHSRILANIFAENIYAQVDTEGNECILLPEICDCQKDLLGIARDDMCVEHMKSGSKAYYVQTMKGWQLLVQWEV